MQPALVRSPPQVNSERRQGAGSGTVRVFRVEGTPNTRIILGENGQIAIVGDQTLYLNSAAKRVPQSSSR